MPDEKNGWIESAMMYVRVCLMFERREGRMEVVVRTDFFRYMGNSVDHWWMRPGSREVGKEGVRYENDSTLVCLISCVYLEDACVLPPKTSVPNPSNHYLLDSHSLLSSHPIPSPLPPCLSPSPLSPLLLISYPFPSHRSTLSQWTHLVESHPISYLLFLAETPHHTTYTEMHNLIYIPSPQYYYNDR